MKFFDSFKRKRPLEQSQREFTKWTQNYAEDLAMEHNGLLNYSVESLILLDYILEGSIAPYKNGDQEFKDRLIARSTAYIFEVARRTYGGIYDWSDKYNQVIYIYLGGDNKEDPEFVVALLAFDKVKGRLENGIEDNIPHFFEGLMEAIEAKKTAVIG